MWKRNWTKASLAAACLLLLGCGAGAGQGAREASCDPGVLDAGFALQLSGDYNVEDLSDPLASELGAEGGAFSFWRAGVEGVPFQGPPELLCESIRFPGKRQAQSFVATLEHDPGRIAGSLFAWDANKVDFRAAGTGGTFAGADSDFLALVASDGAHARIVIVQAPRANERAAEFRPLLETFRD